MNTTSIRISEIHFQTATQTRAAMDDETINAYAERMLEGDKFPPVVLYRDSDGKHWIADGWHRLMAAKKAGFIDFLAEVHNGGMVDALRHALGANVGHGLRRTNADKRHCVELALAEFGHLSDRQIAEMCAVSVMMVGRIRPTPEQKDNCNNVTVPPQKRLGADGKERTVPARKPAPMPVAPVADAVQGVQVPVATPPPASQPTSEPASNNGWHLPPNTRLAKVGIGLQYARLAILQLDKIPKKDIEEAAALREVIGYAEQRLKKLS